MLRSTFSSDVKGCSPSPTLDEKTKQKCLENKGLCTNKSLRRLISAEAKKFIEDRNLGVGLER